jgi:outer membrane PBP1 activator LpoA protein
MSPAEPPYDNVMTNRTAFIAIALAVVLLAGCAAGPGVGPSEDERKALAQQALALHAEGRFREAAQEYLRLARASQAPLSQDFALSAAAELIEAGELKAAKKLLDEVLPPSLAPVLEAWRTAHRAEIALIELRPYDALALLPPQLKTTLPRSLAARISDLRARALHDGGQYLASAEERAALDPLLVSPHAIAENQRRLWTSVSRLPPAELREAQRPPPDTLGGWLELGVIASGLMMGPEALANEINLWRARYPDHPAEAVIVPLLIELARESAAPPSKLVLLLPLDGAFKGAAAAVRDGFLSAWFADSDNLRRPEVLIRTIPDDEIWPAYQQAVAEGAEFVVGPLRRTSVNAIAAVERLPVPTLALNYVSNVPQAPQNVDELDAAGFVPAAPRVLSELLYQFALSPEDESRAVATRAWFDGHGKAAVLAPEGEWGSRVVDAFVSELERLGGEVVGIRRYESDATDMSGPVKAVLNVDSSEERRRELTRVLGEKVEFEAQRRQDVDFIFMGAFPVQARQIRPALKFHHAVGVPVYATSHTYTGIPDPAADIDVDGVIFADMPWTVETQAAAGLRSVIMSTWPKSLPRYFRLYAFGADAYSLVPRLRTLKAQRYAEYAGATGHLSISDGNRVERRLLWAQFKEGVPRPLVPSQPPQ